MKKILHNNQVIITALAIMIAIAGYLNFADDEKNAKKTGEVFEAMDTEPSQTPKAETAEVTKEKKTNVGEAVLVNSSINLNYFYKAKLNREQTRAKSKEELMKIVDNKKLDEAQKESALNEIFELTSNSEKEAAAEMLLQAKGFENVVVSLVDGKADVVVDKEKITSEQVAQIEDIVKRKTGLEGKDIVVTPVNSKSKK